MSGSQRIHRLAHASLHQMPETGVRLVEVRSRGVNKLVVGAGMRGAHAMVCIEVGEPARRLANLGCREYELVGWMPNGQPKLAVRLAESTP
jgi:hypothetical protein